MTNPVQQDVKGGLNVGSLFLGGQTATPVYIHAGAPTNGTSGSLATVASIGSLLIDNTVSGVTGLYQNTNTKASPTWTALTTATGAGTYTGTFNGVVGGTTPAAATVTTLTATGLVTESLATGITASVTQTRAGATALARQVNNVTTVANSGDAVKLPAATVGQSIVIFNSGANPASVFPNGASDTIDGGAGGAAVTLTNAKRAVFVCIAANTWISAQLGVASA